MNKVLDKNGVVVAIHTNLKDWERPPANGHTYKRGTRIVNSNGVAWR